jgi:hypothetical protein
MGLKRDIPMLYSRKLLASNNFKYGGIKLPIQNYSGERNDY